MTIELGSYYNVKTFCNKITEKEINELGEKLNSEGQEVTDPEDSCSVKKLVTRTWFFRKQIAIMPYSHKEGMFERIEIKKISNIFNRFIAWLENYLRGICARIHNPFLKDTILFLHKIDTSKYSDIEKGNFEKLKVKINKKYKDRHEKVKEDQYHPHDMLYNQPLTDLLAST